MKGLVKVLKLLQAKSYRDMSRKAANIVSAQVLLKEDSVLGLATGSTPIGVYKQLIKWQHQDDISFTHVSTLNLDEYCGMAPHHQQSYAYFMRQNFFDSIDIRLENTYLPNGIAKDFSEECRHYDALVERLGGIDLQLIGIGLNGHIGFNEPGEAFLMDTHRVALSENTRAANARFFSGELRAVPGFAITMGIRHIMQAKRVLLVVNGSKKMEILDRSMHGPVTPRVPASILQLHTNLTVVFCPNDN